MFKQKTVIVISSMVIGLVVASEVIGSGRTATFLRCQWWHATHEPELQFRGLQVRLPLNWFPIEQEGTPMLSMVPSSRSSRIVILILSSISDQDERSLVSGKAFPRVMEVLGETMRLESGPLQLEVNGMTAVRLHYVAEDRESESLLVWLFPIQGVSASSYKVHRADIEPLDRLVSTFTSDRSH
jgi:hypothetical protein